MARPFQTNLVRTNRRNSFPIGAPGVRASALGVVLGLLLVPEHCGFCAVCSMVGVYEVPTILTVVLMLASVILIAITAPTLRVARIDPAQTLRDDETTRFALHARA